MTGLASSAAMPDMTFFIGDPTLTQGPYGFEASPSNCGHEPTVTIAGLPPFFTHDPLNRMFTVPSTTDETMIGSYTVAIVGAISVRDDSSATTETEYSHAQTFVIYIEPCQVTSLVST